ncbi:threonine transporter RhtB [Gammaproteobacteria bacterium 45_16_T64]|nr:threonine transporter RhtB [Gammaproteobacteria bacterium 45_16_T64]
MLTVETLVTFVLASALLSFAPGPDNIFVLIQSATHGRKAGAFITLGLCTGLLVHTAMVVLGVAALIQASEFAFNGLKIVGAGYLCYLAWSAYSAADSELDISGVPQLSNLALYRRGIVMNVTNPKVAIFFLAFLPQFTNSQEGDVSLQMMLLGWVFILVALVCFLCIAYLSGFLNRWFRESAVAQRYLHRAVSVVFVCLAVKLLFTAV